MNEYIFKQAENKSDLDQLKSLFNQVFYPEKVGELAQIMSQHLPGMSPENWFVVKNSENQNIVSACAMIPWLWQFSGVHLKVAEMGIVGTAEEHRGKGLMKKNNDQFDKALIEQGIDLAVIQGIPGFYHRLGYHYALPMEHHTEVPLFSIPESSDLVFCKAELDDIPFLVSDGNRCSDNYAITSVRSADHWEYILKHAIATEYASEIYITEFEGLHYFFRILKQGFGQGLIISESSSCLPMMVQKAILSFAAKKAKEDDKPYIRLNLPHQHQLVKTAMQYGAVIRPSYGWQIKVANPQSFVQRIKPLLEKRIEESSFKGLNAMVTLDFYTFTIQLKWQKGKLIEFSDKVDSSDYLMSIPEDLMAPLLLGFRSWQEMQYLRPDIFPADQFLRMDVLKPSEESGALMDVLFPKLDNWIYCQY
jgi:predicted N-acetyltransferase YhbS